MGTASILMVSTSIVTGRSTTTTRCTSILGTREQESRLPSSYTGTTGPQSLFDATRDDDRETSQAEIRIGSDLGR